MFEFWGSHSNPIADHGDIWRARVNLFNLMRQWIQVIQLTMTGKKAKAYICPMSHNIKLDSHCSLSPNNLKF